MIIVQFVLAFGIMVFLHELGHFLVSKAFKIEIEEFGLGLPPRLCKLFTAGGTDFTLNWLPFGAFVRPKGEFDENGGENSLRSAPAWQQILILLAGPLMNLLTAAVIFTICIQQMGFADPSVVLIDNVEKDSPAEIAGMQPGDQIVSIAGITIDNFDLVSATVQDNLDKNVPIQVKRDGDVLSLSVTPSSTPPEGQGAMGVVITYPMTDATLWQSVRSGFSETGYMVKQYLVGIGQIITGKLQMGLDSIVGPVGMYSYYADAAEEDQKTSAEIEQRMEEKEEAGISTEQRTASTAQTPWLNRLSFFAVIAIALGVTNLFPIPALDGGRILFLLPDLLFKKKIPVKVENYFNSFCMIALLLLMAVIMFKDIFMLSNA